MKVVDNVLKMVPSLHKVYSTLTSCLVQRLKRRKDFLRPQYIQSTNSTNVTPAINIKITT